MSLSTPKASDMFVFNVGTESVESLPSPLCLCLCSIGQQPAVSGDMFRLCVNAAASPADQQLNVRLSVVGNLYSRTLSPDVCLMLLFSVLRGTSQKCDFSVQVQLRFCLSETSCPQEDHFPPNLCVKVNGKPCNLPVRSSALNNYCSFFFLRLSAEDLMTYFHASVKLLFLRSQ